MIFRGASLRPLPPGQSKQKELRYLDIREDDQIDEAQFADWVKQASQLPGERMREAIAKRKVPTTCLARSIGRAQRELRLFCCRA